MQLTFSAVPKPVRDLVDQIADLTPENPFYTPEYLEVRRKRGSEVWAISLNSENAPVSGCFGFLSRGRLNSRLEITSLPVLADEPSFWSGLFDFCRSANIAALSVNTFASAATTISQKENLIARTRRNEFRLDLTQPDLWKMMNRRHHRLIKRAKSEGLSIRRANDREAREIHVELANVSLDRRRGRGYSIDSRIELTDVNAFLDLGAGELLQAVKGNEVHATILVARSRTGAYAQSSGTSSDGRNMGASHFLFHEAACSLKEEGLTVFNLGGADEESTGLQEFKLGLGSESIELESAEFFVGSKWKRFASGAISLLKGVTLPI